MNITKRNGLLAGVGLAAVLLAAATPALASGTTTVTQTAVTHITNRPDSGDQGNNWADDNFTRTATVVRHGLVAPSNCGVVSGSCWDYTYTITDKGTATTIPGQQSPRTGIILDLEVTASMNGGTHNGQFYATSGSPHASLVPTTENDHDAVPTGNSTTGNWIRQFFLGTTVFGANNLGSWGWTYRLNFGGDTQCPNDAYQWVDALASGGGVGNINGDILAPDASHCT